MELLVPQGQQGLFSVFTALVVRLFAVAAPPLDARFPDQSPAIQQIFLNLQLAESGGCAIQWRGLHVNTHGEERAIIGFVSGIVRVSVTDLFVRKKLSGLLLEAL